MNGWSVASDLFEVQVRGALRLAARLVPKKVGTEWFAVSYDWHKVVILPGHNDNHIVVVDFGRANTSKSCELPAFPDGYLTEQWLADLPGVGQSFVGRTAGTRDHLYAIKLDASTPCVDIHDKDLSRKKTLLPALDGRVFRSAGLRLTNRATICRLRLVVGWVNVSSAVDCAEPAGPDIHLRERRKTVHED